MRGTGKGPSKGATGWEFFHVCVDDATRLAYAEVLSDERGETSIGFLERAIAWFESMGVTAARVRSDNGSGYRSHAYADACWTLGIKHTFTRLRKFGSVS